MDQFNQAQPTHRMTPDQMRALSEKLSPEDKQRVGEILRSCSGEIMLKRGVPIAVLIVTGMHFARDKLPPSLRIGPRRWFFNAFLATGCLTLSNILFANPCLDRLQPLMNELNQKYNNPNYAPAGSASRYNQLRDANRQSANYNIPPPSASYGQIVPPLNQSYDNVQTDQATESYLREQPPALEEQSRRRFKKYEDTTPYFMSGTPIRSNIQADSVQLSNDVSTGKSSKYGDVDFS